MHEIIQEYYGQTLQSSTDVLAQLVGARGAVIGGDMTEEPSRVMSRSSIATMPPHPDTAIEAVNRSLLMSPRDPFNFSYRHYVGRVFFSRTLR